MSRSEQTGSDSAPRNTCRNGTVHLPPAYVAEHVELAYARTAIAGQGRTVKGGLLFMDGTTDVRNVYVAVDPACSTGPSCVS